MGYIPWGSVVLFLDVDVLDYYSFINFNRLKIAPINKVSNENIRPPENNKMLTFMHSFKKNLSEWNLSPPRGNMILSYQKHLNTTYIATRPNDTNIDTRGNGKIFIISSIPINHMTTLHFPWKYEARISKSETITNDQNSKDLF